MKTVLPQPFFWLTQFWMTSRETAAKETTKQMKWKSIHAATTFYIENPLNWSFRCIASTVADGTPVSCELLEAFALSGEEFSKWESDKLSKTVSKKSSSWRTSYHSSRNSSSKSYSLSSEVLSDECLSVLPSLKTSLITESIFIACLLSQISTNL